MNRDAILENRSDLIEGTFCFELFELQVFNEKLFFELINGIEECLLKGRSNNNGPDKEILSFLRWFVMGVVRCIICHNDINDRYAIKNLNMGSWYEVYEGRLGSLLDRAFDLSY